MNTWYWWGGLVLAALLLGFVLISKKLRDCLLKYHSRITNTCPHPILVVYGRDGLEDDDAEKKELLVLKPDHSCHAPKAYHADFVILRVDDRVIKCRSRFKFLWQDWSWTRFCFEVRSDKKRGDCLIGRIRAMFGPGTGTG